MNAGVYSELARMALQGSGQFLPASNAGLIETRLSKLMLREGYEDLSAMLQSLPMRANSSLRNDVIGEMCDPQTWFFRELDTLKTIVYQLIPAVLRRSSNGRVRIWCAGASTGQEALSLAMMLDDQPNLAHADIQILATDINAARMRYSRAGIYTHFEAQRGLPIRHLLTYFEKHEKKSWAVKPSLLEAISFKAQNLLEPACDLGRFDIILCRNVFRSMAPDSQKKAISHIITQLHPNGALVIGETESLGFINTEIVPSLANRAVYERVSDVTEPVAA